MDAHRCYHSRVGRFGRSAAHVALAATLVSGALLAACESRPAAPAAAAPAARPLVVQGAMDVEVKALVAALEGATEERVQAWTFWKGTVDGYPVVVSKTFKGMSSAAAATALAVERYHPVAIINQGTSGGHNADLRVFDIVLGTESVSLGAFKTGYRRRGDGSDFTGWQPLDLMRTEGSAGQDPNALVMRRFRADEGLLAAAGSVRATYARGRVVDGVIGSSDMWNSELDRIQRFHDEFGTSVEEMETAAASQIAGLSQIPFLGIRVLSNNITNGGSYDAGTAEACQEYVHQVVKAYVRRILKP